MKNPSRLGMTKPIESDQSKRRRYRLHYNLKQRGGKVNGRTRTITLAGCYDKTTQRWCTELIALGYCIQKQELIANC